MKKRICLLSFILLLLGTLCACSLFTKRSTTTSEGSIGGIISSYNLTFEYNESADGYYITSNSMYGDGPIHLDLPSRYNDGVHGTKDVVAIGSNAFFILHEMKTITLPQTLRYIQTNAFNGCDSLQSIFIPKNVTRIENGAFYRCKSLEKIEVDPENPYYHVEGGCLYSTNPDSDYVLLLAGCSDSVIPQDRGITAIGTGAFYGKTGLTKVDIPDTVTVLDYAAFSESGITEIVIPDSVKTINRCVFSNCYSLKKVTLGNGITEINNEMFSQCSLLESIIISDAVTRIGSNAFAMCRNLSEVSIGKNVRTIDFEAFDSCSALTELTIPAATDAINYCFVRGCTSLKKLTFESDDEWRLCESADFKNRCGGIKVSTEYLNDHLDLLCYARGFSCLYKTDHFGE